MISTITGIEIEKLARRKFSIILLGLMIIIQIILAIIGYRLRIKEMELGTGFQVAAFSIQFVLQVMTLVILALSSISLSGETASGTIKTVLARNIKRSEFILGKFTALFLLGVMVLIIIYITGLVAGLFSGGLVSLKDGDYLLCSAGTLTGNYFISMLLFIPPLAALISFGILISVLISGSGGAVGTGIISFLILQMLSHVDRIDKYFFTRYLTLPINIYSKMTEGIFLAQKASVYWNIGISTLCTILFLGLSLIIFCKKDIWE